VRVGEVMTREVQSATPEDDLRKVAEQMAQLDVGALPVCQDRKVIGMITDRDLVVRGLAQGAGVDSKIRDFMTSSVETVHEDDDLEEVNDRMSAAQVRRLPVVGGDGELVGIISLADVARTDEAGEVGATVAEISEDSN
jgi:CBS domain-containing protein